MTRRVCVRRSPILIAMMIWNSARSRGCVLQIARDLAGPLLRLLPFTAVRRFFGPIERMLAGIPSLPRSLRSLVQTGLSPSPPPRDLFAVFALLAARVVSGISRRIAVLAALGREIPLRQASALRGAALRLPLAAPGSGTPAWPSWAVIATGRRPLNSRVGAQRRGAVGAAGWARRTTEPAWPVTRHPALHARLTPRVLPIRFGRSNCPTLRPLPSGLAIWVRRPSRC